MVVTQEEVINYLALNREASTLFISLSAVVDTVNHFLAKKANAESKGMTFLEAMEHVAQGRLVRRRSWDPKYYCYKDDSGSLLIFPSDNKHGICLFIADTAATDWEICNA